MFAFRTGIILSYVKKCKSKRDDNIFDHATSNRHMTVKGNPLNLVPLISMLCLDDTYLKNQAFFLTILTQLNQRLIVPDNR